MKNIGFIGDVPCRYSDEKSGRIGSQFLGISIKIVK